MRRFFLLITGFLILFSACRKENPINTDPSLKLSFSADTVLFDTVFTTIGSSIHQLKVYNKYDDDLNISEIRLFGGEQSRFKLNLDGESGWEFHDKVIPANDSLFTFLNVTIDPNDHSSPFVVEDSLLFVTNGNQQMVKLVAWGQNAHYIIADRKVQGLPKFIIVADSLETTHWYNDLPYVIYGYALINSYGTLHIHEGVRIYMHDLGYDDHCGLLSWSDGQLIIEGTAENPVTIQGDRMEPYFKDQPGQWDRIWLMDGRPGGDHIISHAILRNAFVGIQAESFLKATQAALYIDNTVIENNTGWGILARNYAIGADNLVIDNCAGYNFEAQMGGYYVFRHTTMGNYWWQSPRTTPSMLFSNVVEDQEGVQHEIPFHFEMGNSIVYGSAEDEFKTALRGNEVDTTYLFDHCLIRSLKHQSSEAFVNCIFNQDPMFVDYRSFDLHLSDALSPAVGTGSPVIGAMVPYDIEGNSRLGTPDLGAYQHRD